MTASDLRAGSDRAGDTRLRLCFVVESGTDVRMVEGLAERCELTLVTRQVVGGKTISQPTGARSHRRPAHRRSSDSPCSRSGGSFGSARLRRDSGSGVRPGGDGRQHRRRLVGRPAVMLVCSPVEGYYVCRRADRFGQAVQAHGMDRHPRAGASNARVGQAVRCAEPVSRTGRAAARHSGQVAVIPVYGIDTALFVALDRRPRAPAGSTGAASRLLRWSSSAAGSRRKRIPTRSSRPSVALRRQGGDVRILHLSGGYEEFLARAPARRGWRTP